MKFKQYEIEDKFFFNGETYEITDISFVRDFDGKLVDCVYTVNGDVENKLTSLELDRAIQS